MHLSLAQQATVDKKQDQTVQQRKAEVHHYARRQIVYVYLYADARRNVSDHRLRHAIHADRSSRQGVLHQTNGGAGQRSHRGAASRDSEEDCHNQREIEIRETPVEL